MTLNHDILPLEIQDFLKPILSLSSSSHQGMTSQVFFAESSQGSVVIKHARGRHIEALRQENVILNSLHFPELPTPQVLFFYEQTLDDHSPEAWLVINRLPGKPLIHLLKAKILAPHIHTHLFFCLGKLIRQLHQLPSTSAPIDFDSDWLDDMLTKAQHNLEAGIGEGTVQQLEFLHANRPQSIPSTFIHGDLFLDNILSDGTMITGLIDWPFCSFGDPRYDMTLALYGTTFKERQAFFDGYGTQDNLSESEFDFFLKLALFF